MYGDAADNAVGTLGVARCGFGSSWSLSRLECNSEGSELATMDDGDPNGDASADAAAVDAASVDAG